MTLALPHDAHQEFCRSCNTSGRTIVDGACMVCHQRPTAVPGDECAACNGTRGSLERPCVWCDGVGVVPAPSLGVALAPSFSGRSVGRDEWDWRNGR